MKFSEQKFIEIAKFNIRKGLEYVNTLRNTPAKPITIAQFDALLKAINASDEITTHELADIQEILLNASKRLLPDYKSEKEI